jgi:hypothetical protein
MLVTHLKDLELRIRLELVSKFNKGEVKITKTQEPNMPFEKLYARTQYMYSQIEKFPDKDFSELKKEKVYEITSLANELEAQFFPEKDVINYDQALTYR